ncbi:MAG: ATP-binding protein [Chloroflexota bacterium]|nr:ATP-binding protein [Chloroflexota bacterium]
MNAGENGLVAVIVIGGFAGTGKTTLSKRLSAEFGIPRLSSDAIGRTVSRSQGIRDQRVNAIAIAYDVVFDLCAEFLQCGVSAILDVNMGWAFQWEHIDVLRDQQPAVKWVPILLRCPWELCMERIRQRHAAEPTMSAPPEVYMTTPHILNVWTFLEQLKRPDVHVVDAARSEDEVYASIKQYLTHIGLSP